jgi:hypothetical protein
MPASLQTSVGAPELVALPLEANPPDVLLAPDDPLPPLLVFPLLLLVSPPELEAVVSLNGEPELPPAAQAARGNTRARAKPQGRSRDGRSPAPPEPGRNLVEVGATLF